MPESLDQLRAAEEGARLEVMASKRNHLEKRASLSRYREAIERRVRAEDVLEPVPPSRSGVVSGAKPTMTAAEESEPTP